MLSGNRLGHVSDWYANSPFCAVSMPYLFNNLGEVLALAGRSGPDILNCHLLNVVSTCEAGARDRGMPAGSALIARRTITGPAAERGKLS